MARHCRRRRLRLTRPNGRVSYSATGLPPGMTLDAVTGVISGTPTTAGVYTVTVTVSDGVTSTPTTFTWTVIANQAPVVTAIANRTDVVGAAVSVGVTATDPDGSYARAVLASAPVAYWQLNESSGLTAADASGQGRSATYVNGVTLGAVGALGDATTAADFNGAGAYVAAPNLNLTGSFTLEGWVYYTGPGVGGLDRLWHRVRLCGRPPHLDWRRLGICWRRWRETISSRRAPVPLNTWTHVVYRYDAALNQQAFFVNGVAAGIEHATDDGHVEQRIPHLATSERHAVSLQRDGWTRWRCMARRCRRRRLRLTPQDVGYAATGLPPGVTLDAATGVISGDADDGGGLHRDGDGE